MAADQSTRVSRFVVAEDDTVTEPYRPIVDSEDEDQSHDDTPTFDDKEDAKYIEESKRRALKKKGVNPRAGRPVAAATQ